MTPITTVLVALALAFAVYGSLIGLLICGVLGLANELLAAWASQPDEDPLAPIE